MEKNRGVYAIIFATILLLGVFVFMESTAWARAGRGGSMGSRGSKSFSSPQSPSQSSPGYSSPGRTATPGSSPMSGGLTRSPFMQGLAGGLAGGLLGSMLFGGMGHAAGAGGAGGGGIGFMDILIIGALLYFLWKFLKRRKQQENPAAAYSGSGGSPSRIEGYSTPSGMGSPAYGGMSQDTAPAHDDVERGFAQLRQYDPGFNEETLKENLQDIFFRIQAGWMNRSVEGIDNMLTAEMRDIMGKEFETMKQMGRTNRLENIAVRKVQPTEVWQETGKDFVTVLFTANLLDYTVDDKTGNVVEGDKMNPVKFLEYWTFCRDIGSRNWQLSAINQAD
jgi:predicted lipid-binding transport protein (Tim44 family)